MLHKLPLIVATAMIYLLVETYIAFARPISVPSPEALALSKDTQALRVLAQHQVGTLTRCESLVLAEALAGKVAICSVFAPKDRVVTGVFLKWILTDPKAATFINHTVVSIENASINDTVMLEGAEVSPPVLFTDSTLTSLFVNRSVLKGGLTISKSRLSNLYFGQSQLSDLSVKDSSLSSTLSLVDSDTKSLSVSGSVLRNVDVATSTFDTVSFEKVTIDCLRFSPSTVRANLQFIDSWTKNKADFAGLKIEGQFMVDKSHFLASPDSCGTEFRDSNSDMQ